MTSTDVNVPMRLVLLTLIAALGAACSSESTLITAPDELPARPSDPPGPSAPASEGSSGASSAFDARGCESVDSFRAGVEVSGRRLQAHGRIDGDLLALHGTRGRFVFWPNGRHSGTRVESELFHTGNGDDFPLEARVSYLHPGVTERTTFHGNLDFEMLLACFDESNQRFVLGWFDEHGTCTPGEYIVRQCDRGVEYTVE